MSRKAVKAIAFIIILTMVITSFSFLLFLPSASGAEYVYAGTTAQEQKYLNEKIKEFEDYLKLIHDSYKDEIDYETLMNGAFEGAMFSLGDPYSVFFIEKEDGQAFIEAVTGEYEGVGVTIEKNSGGFCEVTLTSPKGPGDKAGIKSGDLIIKIDGKDVSSKSISEISALLKGPAGTVVSVTVKRADSELKFDVKREKVAVKSVYYHMLEGNIGYIFMTGFDKSGAADFKEAKQALIKEGAKSLIVDIRNNPGGLLGTVFEISEEFLDKGDIIMHSMARGEITETVYANYGKKEKMKTVLLVNENSASAAEILAGALKDNKAATLIGTPTYGKGVSQMMGNTSDGYSYKISVNYFLTPDKSDIQGVGITPDKVVRNSLGEYREYALEFYGSFAPFAESTKPKAGDKGLNVFAAQQRLMLLGFKAELTAVMDEATISAMKAFQAEQGLYVYGTLDLTTMKKLEEAALAYINNDSKEDLQLKAAIELLKK